MSRWFRHYAGMMRDEKLVAAAMRSQQSVERVVWVWGAILESAAEINDGGRYELDQAECAYFLRVDTGDIAAIEASLEVLGRVREGVVGKWGSRQFQSDRSADRQQRYRERHRQERELGGSGGREGVAAVTETEGDGRVTAASRHGDAPETETYTEAETEKKEEKKEETREGALASADWPSDFRERFWEKYPNKVGKPDALKKLERVRKAAGVPWAELWGGLERYVAKADDRPWCNPATWIHQQRWTDQPANGTQNGHGPTRSQADKSTSAAAGRLLEKIRALDRPVGQN